MRGESYLKKLNSILKDYDQELQILELSVERAVLSNGLVIEGRSEVKKLKLRITKNSSSFKKNFDKIYSMDEQLARETLRQLRFEVSSAAGKKAQRQSGHKIHKNLNTNGNGPWNKDMKGNYPYTPSFSEVTRKKISESKKGEKNAMYGKTHSDEYKRRASEYMKQKILSGEFTPNSNNRNTHWESKYRDMYFRSSWEALYQYFNPEAEYESVRILYEYDERERVYIVDFADHKSRTLIEVKPKSMTHDDQSVAKIEAAKRWCDQNDYRMIIADETFFYDMGEPNDYSDFSDKTAKKIRGFYARSK